MDDKENVNRIRIEIMNILEKENNQHALAALLSVLIIGYTCAGCSEEALLKIVKTSYRGLIKLLESEKTSNKGFTLQ